MDPVKRLLSDATTTSDAKADHTLDQQLEDNNPKAYNIILEQAETVSSPGENHTSTVALASANTSMLNADLTTVAKRKKLAKLYANASAPVTLTTVGRKDNITSTSSVSLGRKNFPALGKLGQSQSQSQPTTMASSGNSSAEFDDDFYHHYEGHYENQRIIEEDWYERCKVSAGQYRCKESIRIMIKEGLFDEYFEDDVQLMTPSERMIDKFRRSCEEADEARDTELDIDACVADLVVEAQAKDLAKRIYAGHDLSNPKDDGMKVLGLILGGLLVFIIVALVVLCWDSMRNSDSRGGGEKSKKRRSKSPVTSGRSDKAKR